MRDPSTPSLFAGDLELNFDRCCLVVDGRDVQLTPRDLAITWYLMRHTNSPRTAHVIAEGIGQEFIGYQTIRNQICTINRKAGRRVIFCRRGYGYFIREEATA